MEFINFHILYHAKKEPIFDTEIAEELAGHGYSISPGTLYSPFIASKKAII